MQWPPRFLKVITCPLLFSLPLSFKDLILHSRGHEGWGGGALSFFISLNTRKLHMEGESWCKDEMFPRF